jgi:uncharacterized protein (DUF1800 family)
LPISRAAVPAALFAALLPLAAHAGAAASDRQIIQLLDRIGFGPTKAEVAHVRAIGIEAYINEQLHPAAIPEPPQLTARLAALMTLKLDPGELFAKYGPLPPVDGVKPTRQQQMARFKAARIIVQQAAAARVWRALYSPRQLKQVLVDFWFNHFNIFAGKGLDRLWVGAYEREAIRPYVLGHFRNLLLATARSAAMLFYLDTWRDSTPRVLPNGRRVGGINENYAREVMELHTLGVTGGYKQADVDALAHLLTGWGLRPPPERRFPGSEFFFDVARHDFASQTFLGRRIAAGGERQGVEALDMLARSPATAHHIAFELARYFVADNPPATLVDRLARRFEATDGDIRAVLATLFASPQFRDSAGAKYKAPDRFVLSAVRATGVAVDNPRPILGMIARLGMPLYGCVMPNGYADTKAAWLSPDQTMLRVSFATALGAGRLPLDTPVTAQDATAAPGGRLPVRRVAATPAPVDPDALARLLDPILSRRTRAAIAAAPRALRAAMILGSPDFMRQ